VTYRIELSRNARKALLAIAARDRRRLERAIDGLARNPRPHGARKLEGGAGELRVRVGVYRIVYEVDDPVLRVLVLRVGHRREVYRRG
jgi:mRNA interferase RelE/StbE